MAACCPTISDLPNVLREKLAHILDESNTPTWRELIHVMPPDTYRAHQVESFAMATLKCRSPTQELFDDLARRSVTLDELSGWVQKLPQSNKKQSMIQLLYGHPVVTRQPGNIMVAVGANAVLSCGATGHQPLNYQWFKSKKALEGQTGSLLRVKNVSKLDEGHYICRVANSNGDYVFTEWAKLSLQNPSETHQFSRPIITSQPEYPEVHTVLGGTLRLYCDALGDPAPTFQWYKNDLPLPDGDQREYCKRDICADDQGRYMCVASNSSGSTESMPTRVFVRHQVPRGQMEANDKVALLIGNKDYKMAQHLNTLFHPLNDVCDLAGVLRSIGFKVVSLVNLTLKEMEFALDEFYKLLVKDTYALFYFAGHGFEINGQGYLMPIDATERYHPQENLPASKVLETMQNSEAKLNIIVLDCCRTTPNDKPIETIPVDNGCYQPIVTKANVLVIHGCLPQNSVFESEDERNGFIAKHLIKLIGQTKPLSKIKLEFSKAIHDENIYDPEDRKQQVVHIHTTEIDDMCLADNTAVHMQGACAVSGAEGWKAAHEIPEDPVTVHERDGVVVELVFMAEFSNALLVTARCRPDNYHVTFDMPECVSGCLVTKVTGKESTIPQRFSRAESAIRIADLQRLQGNLEMVLVLELDNEEPRRICYTMREKPLFAKIACQN
ncbi:mucosa-associated lymphoid tissue lymphoma translocation protein 1 isoform X1 [Nematostella vectensis]|uniref:mucosa-associated lymphoid tissue lymphoma translocation protein 1 isoform X1 n=1 Tax=Nematostella vectensis TaxID=45351 RepID=UPI0020777C29|nr:mucosa-associated lymphoid tissue lymphoma translocation protein 1 isoform X1 [Nematostella vectensis]